MSIYRNLLLTNVYYYKLVRVSVFRERVCESNIIRHFLLVFVLFVHQGLENKHQSFHDQKISSSKSFTTSFVFPESDRKKVLNEYLSYEREKRCLEQQQPRSSKKTAKDCDTAVRGAFTFIILLTNGGIHSFDSFQLL